GDGSLVALGRRGGGPRRRQRSCGDGCFRLFRRSRRFRGRLGIVATGQREQRRGVPGHSGLKAEASASTCRMRNSTRMLLCHSASFLGGHGSLPQMPVLGCVMPWPTTANCVGSSDTPWVLAYAIRLSRTAIARE